MTDITAFNSDYVTTRRAPLDPTTRRSRRFGLAVAIGLHAAVIALLMTVRPWAPAAPEQLVYDLVFVEPAAAPPPPAAEPPDANLPETPAGPPELVTEPEPAPMVTSVPELPKPAPRPHPPVRHPTPAPAPRAAEAPAAAAPTQTDSSGSSPMAPPNPSPPAVAAHPPPDLAYTATLLTWLNQHKEYPWMARRRGVQGRVILRLAVARSGNVTEARIETSSGAELLDQAAVDMVHRANPLPPLPASFVGDRAEFRVPVEFALSRQ
ncbi:MAG TPA: energy transducer TonB [Alphaproteobacteria bacterium]